MIEKKIAIMQPYFFPYIGYFQLMKCVDHFVFYDDVNFIKGGWIQRNRILNSKEVNYISVPLIGASSYKKINEIEINLNEIAQSKLLKTITYNYGKTPYFNDIMPIVQAVIVDKSTQNLAQIAAKSTIAVANYLSMNTTFFFSSELDFGKKATERADRLVEIVNGFKSKIYINSEGGKELYNKAFFESNGIELKFIKPHLAEYRQNSDEFIPGLSIIDVLMHNSKNEILSMLDQYELE
jgi:hypothetical protein